MTLHSYARDTQHPRRQLIAELLTQPRGLLVTLMMGNVTVNSLIQNVYSGSVGENGGWLLKVGVPLVITLILGEIIPKAIALPYHRALADWTGPTVAYLYRILSPLRKAILAVTNPISRAMFFFLPAERPLLTAEVEHAIGTSHETGLLSQDEMAFLKGTLRLREVSVRELMRPRDEVLYYDMTQPLSQLTHLFTDLECSQVPVCRGGLDAILGILSLQTYFLERNRITHPEALLPLLRQPVYLPELMIARTALSQLRQRQETLALVVDEYGALAGLITQEDLMETVVGEIADQRDEKARYSWLGNDTLVASGKLEMAELQQLMGVQLPNPHRLVTVGGWLADRLGTIPATGVRYREGTLVFQVLASDPQRVRRL